jgi:hypothetical protein
MGVFFVNLRGDCSLSRPGFSHAWRRGTRTSPRDRRDFDAMLWFVVDELDVHQDDNVV